MKPNFALSLSFEGIRLLHRAAGGWRVVGDVALNAEDMTAELAVLRRTAAALEPGGVRSKVIIPNDQIRYLTFDSAGLSGEALNAAARAALDGATPYAVEDLVFDVSPEGSLSHIAAVARETLDEAEAFAEEHRFHPVSFAAIPGENAYLGEPFFGQTGAARTLLEPGERVEADGIAVVVIGDIIPPSGPVAAAAGEKETDPASPKEAVVAAQTDDSTDADGAEDAAPPPVTADEPPVPDATDASLLPEPPALRDDMSQERVSERIVVEELPPAKAPSPAEPERPETADDTKEKGAQVSTAADIPTADDPTPPEASDAPPRPEPAPASAGPAKVDGSAEAADPTPPLPTSGDGAATPPDPERPRSGPRADPKSSDPRILPPAPEPSGVKTPAVTAPVAAKAAPEPVGAAPLAGFASRRSLARERSVVPLAGATRGNDTKAAPGIAASRAASPQPDSSSLSQAAPATSRVGFLSRRKSKATGKAGSPRPGTAAIASAPAFAGNGAASEAERMTIFGARKSADVGGKPRFLGLLLTAALLIFLAGVAAWASVFLDDGISLSRLFGDREPRVTASDPATVPSEAIAAAPQETPPVALARPLANEAVPQTEATRTASIDPELTDTDDAVLDALRDPILPSSEPLTDQQVAERYAVSGIWPRAPEVPEPPAVIPLEDLYLTGIDPVSTSTDAVALPAADSFVSDVTLASLASPAAADASFTLDTRGLVVPTPEGAVTPDGILVFLGRPPVVPPDAPTRAIAEPEVDPARAELVGFRPRPRPGDLVETTERAQLDGLTRNELAGFRPALRPASVQERAEAAVAEAALPAPVDTDAAVTAALAVPEAPPPAIENATRNAVQVSLRPDTRPRNFARIVQRAQRSAAAEPQQVASAAATVAPRAVQPSIPSTASVARQATVKNAINLRDVNLIGVYGKPSNRRALVRLGNGRYQKVVVGDRMDGGRVSAIGDSELRYTKRGRDVVLRMPRN